MRKNSSLPAFGQWAAGIALMLVVITAGALSLVVNVSYGLSAGLALAVAYGLSDIAKLTLPVVASAIGWSRHMRLVAIAASVVSIWCAANYFADTEGQRLMTASHHTGQTQAAITERDRLQAELAALRPAGDVAALQMRVDTLQQAISDETAAGGCGPRCRDLQRQRASVLADLATASRKADLEARLAGLADTIGARPPVETSGLAAFAVASVGGDKQRWARWVVTIRALAALILVEMLAHLAGAAARLIGQAMTARRKKKAAATSAKAEPRLLTPPRIGISHNERARHGLASLAGVSL